MRNSLKVYVKRLKKRKEIEQATITINILSHRTCDNCWYNPKASNESEVNSNSIVWQISSIEEGCSNPKRNEDKIPDIRTCSNWEDL